jgi:hypothetical protein
MTQQNTTSTTAGPTVPVGSPNAPEAPNKVRSRKLLLWAAAACCAIVAVQLARNGRAPQVPPKLPDPVASARVVPVPMKAANPSVPAGAATATAVTPAVQAVQAVPALENSTSADAAASRPVPGSDGARNQQANPVEHVGSREILEALQHNADALASLEQGIVDLKEQVAKLTHVPKRPVKTSEAAAPTRTMPTRSNADPDSAQLLSIDLWGDKPSVVVGRKRGDGTEVTFLNEGEKQGRVTVKRADVGSQRAILATDRGDVVLNREE